MTFFATSGSVFAADGSIPLSINRFTQLYLVADAGVAASALITTGLIAASTLAILRAPVAGQSPVITLMSSTCLSISGLENGDVIALMKI